MYWEAAERLERFLKKIIEISATQYSPLQIFYATQFALQKITATHLLFVHARCRIICNALLFVHERCRYICNALLFVHVRCRLYLQQNLLFLQRMYIRCRNNLQRMMRCSFPSYCWHIPPYCNGLCVADFCNAALTCVAENLQPCFLHRKFCNAKCVADCFCNA